MLRAEPADLSSPNSNLSLVMTFITQSRDSWSLWSSIHIWYTRNGDAGDSLVCLGAFPAHWILTANLTSQGLPSWSHQMSFAGHGSSAGTAVSLQATRSTHSIKFYGVLVWSLSRTSEDTRTLWIFSPPAKCGGECPLFLLLRGSLLQQSALGALAIGQLSWAEEHPGSPVLSLQGEIWYS